MQDSLLKMIQSKNHPDSTSFVSAKIQDTVPKTELNLVVRNNQHLETKPLLDNSPIIHLQEVAKQLASCVKKVNDTSLSPLLVRYVRHATCWIEYEDYTTWLFDLKPGVKFSKERANNNLQGKGHQLGSTTDASFRCFSADLLNEYFYSHQLSISVPGLIPKSERTSPATSIPEKYAPCVYPSRPPQKASPPKRMRGTAFSQTVIGSRNIS